MKKFHQLEEIPPLIQTKIINKVERIKRKPCFEDLFFFCICNHLDTGHKFLKGECDYEDCSCKKFVEAELKIEIEITTLDLYLMEESSYE